MFRHSRYYRWCSSYCYYLRAPLLVPRCILQTTTTSCSPKYSVYQQQQQQLLEQQQQQTPELSVSSPPPHPNALQQLPHPNAPHRRIKAWSCNHQYNDPLQYSILNKTNQSNDESMELFGKSKTRNALNSTLVIDER